MAGPSQSVILYKLPPLWGLPSLSVSCLQVEAYLRLAQISFAVENCVTPSASPTGRVPALDTSSALVGLLPSEGRAGPSNEHQASAKVIDYLKLNVKSLDSALRPDQQAELLAFSALIESKLTPALLYTTWMEDAAFQKFTSVAYGSHQPFPVSFFGPISTRRQVGKFFCDTDGEQVYEAAKNVLDAFAAKLSTSGPFIFGSCPTSLDALFFGCCAYIRSAPVIHPDLQQCLESHDTLMHFVNHLSEGAFKVPAPAAADIGGFAWSESTRGQASGDGRQSRAASQATVELHRRGKIWLACAAAVIAGYIVLGGQYIQFGFDDEEFDEDGFAE